MPTKAFYNLNDDKQKMILNAAVMEFSNKLFDEASVNQIIKDINMPRGSFYLYFDNKKDIYLYILDKYHIELAKLINKEIKENEGRIFPAFINMYDIILNNSDPKLEKLINNIFQNMNSEQLFKIFPMNDSKKSDLILKNNINFEKIDIVPEQLDVLISILIPLLFQNISHAFRDIDSREEIRNLYIKQIEIIKKGIERDDRNDKII